jgi:hypothetical protein
MARKASIKSITDGINKVAENYFRAANAKGISNDTRKFLEARWACYREVAVILSIKNQSDLSTLVDGSEYWKRDAMRCETEALAM